LHSLPSAGKRFDTRCSYEAGRLPTAICYICPMSVLQKLRQRSRWAFLQGAFALGAGKGWLQDRPGLRILIYHGVVPAPVRRINARFISTAQLEEHLTYIRRHFQVISLAQAYTGDYDRNRMAVVITFDDGYRNNLLHVLPVLQKYRLPATFFVTAAQAAGQDILWADLLDIASATLDGPVYIEGNHYTRNRKGEYVTASGQRLKQHCKDQGPAFIQAMRLAFSAAHFQQDPQWDDYWKLLDAAELRELSRAEGVTIGGHGTLHYNLDGLTLQDAMADVQMGIRWIAQAIGKPVEAFAFPDGAYTLELVEALDAAGLRQLLLTDYRFQDQADTRLRERFTIHPFLPTRVLMAEMLKGHYF
jgi:peptidoglycan/xylan/chitin deacetylase (PgdA/CDA1 family)